MQAESWIKIKETLQDALTLKPFERDEFLEKAGLSPVEKAEIKSLLEFEEESEKFMSVSASGLTGELIFEEEERKNSLAGQKIGIYEIRRELGLGGMGAVYLAERADGKFTQRVALKMLKREFNVEKIRRNFRRESEIQSRLNHPNIARLLDAGTMPDGVPYLVMEYVEGVHVDKFCNEKSLSLNERLKLFNKVCEAVAHAHRNLIIHRDLKPSNILVTSTGEPKLLDFGISKLLGGEPANDESADTFLGAMTPEYASPEQLKGASVTTATDIYSLGVILYKILTGGHPFDSKGNTNGELLKAVTESEPVPPSVISDLGFRISDLNFREKFKLKFSGNQTQPTNPKSQIPNPKSLRGDLDNIILKALSREPERRYRTVEQFSADIWRFIDGLPVSARPATFSYRAAKFFKRNRIPVIAAALIFLSLVAGIAAALRQTRLARDAQRSSAIEAERAKTEQAKSEKITKFMSKIIGYANPAWYAEGANLKGQARVLDAIEDLSGKIDAEFASEPDVAAEIHHKFAEVFLWVSKNQTVEKREYYQQKRRSHALRALELRVQFYGEWHELVAKDLFGTYAIIGKTERERADLLMRAILMMRDTNPNNLNLPYMFEAYSAVLIMPGSDENKIEAYRNAVLPPTGENKYQIAEKMIRESLPVFRVHYKPDNSAVYAAECKLAYALLMQEKWTDFDEHYAVCKKYGEKPENESWAQGSKWYFEWIEKALAEKKAAK